MDAMMLSRGFPSLAPEIVETILSFLPARSLVNLLCVCRLWKQVGDRVLKARRYYTGALFGPHLDLKDWKDTIYKFLDNMKVVPSAVIISSHKLFDDKHENSKLLRHIAANLPTNCPVLTCYAAGIIGEDDKDCVEEFDETKKAMSVLVLPKVEGITVNLFNFSKKDITTNKCNRQRWTNAFGDLAKEDVKFVFLTADTRIHRHIEKLVVGIKKVFGNHVVVIGGLCKMAGVLQGSIKSDVVIGLAIAGDVSSNCMIYHSDNVDSLQDSLARLKKPNQAGERSACFMVSCVAKGEKFYGEKNVESKILRRVFPHTRLFGFFGQGEIGSLDTLTNKNQVNQKNYLHSYSTVFSLLSILDKAEN